MNVHSAEEGKSMPSMAKRNYAHRRRRLGKRAVILLVDDDANLRQAVRAELADAVFEVVEAASASAALAHLRTGLRPSAMLVDFWMPHQTGAEFLAACRQDTRLATIPAIIMTAARPIDLVDHSYLPKPFHPDDLRRVLIDLVSDDITCGMNAASDGRPPRVRRVSVMRGKYRKGPRV